MSYLFPGLNPEKHYKNIYDEINTVLSAAIRKSDQGESDNLKGSYKIYKSQVNTRSQKLLAFVPGTKAFKLKKHFIYMLILYDEAIVTYAKNHGYSYLGSIFNASFMDKTTSSPVGLGDVTVAILNKYYPSWFKTIFLIAASILLFAYFLTGLGALTALGALGTAFAATLLGKALLIVANALPLWSTLTANVFNISEISLFSSLGVFLSLTAYREVVRPGVLKKDMLICAPFDEDEAFTKKTEHTLTKDPNIILIKANPLNLIFILVWQGKVHLNRKLKAKKGFLSFLITWPGALVVFLTEVVLFLWRMCSGIVDLAFYPFVKDKPNENLDAKFKKDDDPELELLNPSKNKRKKSFGKPEVKKKKSPIKIIKDALTPKSKRG